MEGIVCQICTVPYDANRKVPRVLKCGHTFCTECLVNMLSCGYILECAFCRYKCIANYHYEYSYYENARNAIEGKYPINYTLLKIVGYVNKGFGNTNKVKDEIKLHKIENNQKMVNNYDSVSNWKCPIFDKEDTSENFVDYYSDLMPKLKKNIEERRSTIEKFQAKKNDLGKEITKLESWLEEDNKNSEEIWKDICKTTQDFMDLMSKPKKVNLKEKIKKNKLKIKDMPTFELPNITLNIPQVRTSILNINNNIILYKYNN